MVQQILRKGRQVTVFKSPFHFIHQTATSAKYIRRLITLTELWLYVSNKLKDLFGFLIRSEPIYSDLSQPEHVYIDIEQGKLKVVKPPEHTLLDVMQGKYEESSNIRISRITVLNEE